MLTLDDLHQLDYYLSQTSQDWDTDADHEDPDSFYEDGPIDCCLAHCFADDDDEQHAESYAEDRFIDDYAENQAIARYEDGEDNDDE